ncbi:MAG: S8 family serine peptidase [Micromonosporaceae bacterium]|nr:S8 family serine peptidase [Micromonosporaceae bacterium]
MWLSPRTPLFVRSTVAVVAAAVTTAVALSSGAAASASASAGSPNAGATPAGELPVAVAQAALQAAEEAGEPLPESPTGRWLVRLAEPSLATYAGGVAGIAATSPQVTGGELDVTTPTSQAYLDHLAQRQAAVTETIEAALERPVEVPFAYRNVLNAVAVQASAEEAAALATLPEVAAVEPDLLRELTTDASQELIGSPTVWAGETGPDLATQGEGVVVGLIDSGVNPHHPAFAETAPDGFTHTNPLGSGNFLGVCDPDHPNHEDICNDKLIGAWSLLAGSAQDAVGHGSHVASTIAGNRHEATISAGSEEFQVTVQGTAPRANLVSYRACGAVSCPTASILAAVDQAVADGIDALNYSISGRDDPWIDPIDLAFLAAFNAGIYISASAGNSGPGAGTVAKTGPWNAAVAASTTDRIFANPVAVLGPQPVPPQLALVRAWPTDAPALAEDLLAPLRFAGDVGSQTGCSRFPDGAFDGSVALIRFGGFFDCAGTTKVNNAALAGAKAVLLFELDEGTAPSAVTGLSGAPIPALVVDHTRGVALADLAISLHPDPVQVRLGAGTELVRDPELADTTAWFSSRGPSEFDLLAPTFAAPGVNVLAADQALDGDPVQYAFLRGTSMAAPHGTGAGVLLAALHPDWSPAQIRSALALTADPTGLRKSDGVAPADPFDVGSGRLDLAAAGRSGLVLDETHDNFVAANPDQGGDPRTLNLPSMADQRCSQQCGWTREVTSVADAPASYTAQVVAPGGGSVTVTPAEFTLQPGQSQRLEINVDVSGLPSEWAFGAVRLETDGQHAGGAPIADAHLPLAVVPVAPAVTVRPDELGSSQRPGQVVSLPFSVGNQGDGDLRWRIDASPEQCDAVDEIDWLDLDPRSGTVAPGDTQRVQVTLDSTGAPVGELTATICVASNDPQQPLVTVPVTVQVRDEPVIEIGTPTLAASQPGGTLTATTLTIGNAGTAPLDWEVGEAEVGEGPPGVDPDRLALLQRGLALVPDPTTDTVMAFDLRTGDLVDPEFIAPHPVQFSGVVQQLALHPDGDRFLVTVQTGQAPDRGHVVQEFDLNGEYLGVFAPVGGQDLTILRNVRGLTTTPWGTVLVTTADGDNGDAVAEFDADGNHLGRLVETGAGGLDSPWSIEIRDNDLLVAGSSSRAIHRYQLDGTPIETFPTDLVFPQQVIEQDDGNLLVAQPSASQGAIPGVYELDAGGNLIDIYTGAGGARGVHDLPNGNILASSGFSNREVGVFEIDRGASIVDEKIAGVQPRLFTPVQLQAPCDSPGDVPWLDLATPDGGTLAAAGTAGPLAAGSTPPGGSSDVEIVIDSRGLTPGEHTAHLCVTSNDPIEPLVSVPVTITVTEPACDRTITGTFRGALRVDSGLTCLAHGSEVTAPILVGEGASLFASGTTVRGAISTSGARVVELRDSQIAAVVSVRGSTERVALAGNRVTGAVSLVGNTTGDEPIVVSGNRVVGILSCTDNQPPPVDNGVPNEVTGARFGQCAGL